MLAISSIAGMALGSRAQAETEYTPSVSLSQRYDSNVYFGPKEFIPGGRQAWDLITTVGANVQTLNKSRLGDSDLSVGVNGNAFAYNSDLSFVSTDAFASSDLTNWINELVPGLKFRVSDSFRYTPEPPSFLTGGKPAETSDIFSRGIQAVRANTFRNIFSADGEYSLSRAVGFRTNYSYSLNKVGRIFVSSLAGVPVVFFNSSVHSVSMGPTYRFERGDSLFVGYNYVAAEFSGQGRTAHFTAHAIQPEYVTKFLPGWTATISAGATLIEQVGNRTFLSGRFALDTDIDQRTRVQVSVSRKAAPAFFQTGGALISNAAQLSVSHGFSRVLRLTVRGNYAFNETAPADIFSFKTIAGAALLEYKMTRSTTLSLSQDYTWYTYTGVPTFDRYATMLTLRTEWK